MSSQPQQRQIKRILVANRGEIAIRLLQSCHELPSPPHTFGIYTNTDDTHISLGRPHDSIKVPSPASYMDIDFLVNLVKEHNIDAVHPGYGFLSESPEFSKRMWDEARCMVVGPGWEALEKTGDKLKAKVLAQASNVPLLVSMSQPTGNVEEVRAFAKKAQFPIMIKAVDGGGGRGIRLVRSEEELQNAMERCIGESPSRTVFAEQAAVDGFKHIEVQIIGDGQGNARHLWERDCSVQRRFQKIVEIAPTPTGNRRVIGQVIESAVRMAKKIKYLGLGTFEFLVNVKKEEFYFLEINPRLQVEHTITESVCGVDLVLEQLLVAQGLRRLEEIRPGESQEPIKSPKVFSIQLRLCAEDPTNNFSLSIGKITNIHFPNGNGIRVDSHLSKGGSIGSDFDNLMAKIIITASTWEACLTKAQRALAETRVEGVKTNLNLLRAIMSDSHFCSGQADTKWLEQDLSHLIETGEQMSKTIDNTTSKLPPFPTIAAQSSTTSNTTGGTTSFRKGDAWSLILEPATSKSSTNPPSHHLRLDRITTNNFPDSLTADISYTTPGQASTPYKLTLNSTTASSASASSTHRRGDPNNKNHIILPMSGKLIEVLVDEGDEVQENQVVAFIKQMKMELEVRAPRGGKVKWVIELEEDEGDDVAEGVLVCELEGGGEQGKTRESKL